ncbi:hypothetical protein SME04J_04630 [Serratia marcescens]|nr:hypothetical protein SME04J_04630 [Serratia marcescens]
MFGDNHWRKLWQKIAEFTIQKRNDGILIHRKESLLQPPITGALLLGSLVNIGLHWQG